MRRSSISLVLFMTLLFWAVFVMGYLSRDLLRAWVVETHSATLPEQAKLVLTAAFRVFMTFAIFVCVALFSSFLLIFSIGVIQEVWYQVFTRRLVPWLFRTREQLEEPEEDDADIGAPKKPVNARKHSHKTGTEQREPGPEQQQVLKRLMERQKRDREKVTPAAPVEVEVHYDAE